MNRFFQSFPRNSLISYRALISNRFLHGSESSWWNVRTTGSIHKDIIFFIFRIFRLSRVLVNTFFFVFFFFPARRSWWFGATFSRWFRSWSKKSFFIEFLARVGWLNEFKNLDFRMGEIEDLSALIWSSSGAGDLDRDELLLELLIELLRLRPILNKQKFVISYHVSQKEFSHGKTNKFFSKINSILINYLSPIIITLRDSRSLKN